MKILVTGGSGFIGSHLVDVLIKSGHETIIYDLDTPKYGQNCQYIRGDVNDLARLTIHTKSVEYIYHLAAEANVNRFYDSPIFSNYTTANSTLNVLECAGINNVHRVLLASTEWVYGGTEGNENELITEEAPYAQTPDHLYTSSKIAAELFCKNYKALYGVNYTIMRYGIPFGERARPETVTPIFIKKILKDEEITIHGDGSQTRQFIYVKDLAEGNAACLNPKAENEIFNLNGTEKISVIGIVRTIEEILNKKAKLKFIEDRKGNYKGRFISSEKALNILGWKPAMAYKEALKRYVHNYVKELSE